MKDLLIQSGYKFFSYCLRPLRLGFLRPFKHVMFYSFFNIVFLECLNTGHNLLPGKYSSVHLLVQAI